MLDFIYTKIIFINNHFWHGSKISVINKDKNGLNFLGKKWNYVGGLTPLGMRLFFLAGLKHRERYKDFLNEEYNSKKIVF